MTSVLLSHICLKRPTVVRLQQRRGRYIGADLGSCTVIRICGRLNYTDSRLVSEIHNSVCSPVRRSGEQSRMCAEDFRFLSRCFAAKLIAHTGLHHAPSRNLLTRRSFKARTLFVAVITAYKVKFYPFLSEMV